MIDLNDLPVIIHELSASESSSLEWEVAGAVLRIRMANTASSRLADPLAQPSEARVDPVPEASKLLLAPGIGLLRYRHPLGGDLLSSDGADVDVGQLVAVLQVGDVLTPVYSDQAGKIRRLVTEGAVTGYGDPLFQIEPR